MSKQGSLTVRYMRKDSLAFRNVPHTSAKSALEWATVDSVPPPGGQAASFVDADFQALGLGVGGCLNP